MGPLPTWAVWIPVVAAVVTIILATPKLRAIVHSFLHRLSSWLKTMPTAFRRYRDWRRFRPVCEIADCSSVRVRTSNADYRMELTVKVVFQSRDDRNETTIIEDAHANVRSKTRGREVGFFGHYYNLLCSEGTGKFTIPVLGTIERSYEFFREYKMKPLLEDNTHCNIHLGEVYVVGVDIRPLEIQNIPVKVSWVDAV